MGEVSIAIPAHNQSAMFLRECLLSLRAQTYSAWEAIVVDDGSAATISRAIVASMKDDRIRHVRMPGNMGVPVARNTAFRQMRGAFLLPLDADDMLAPDYLEAMVRAANAHEHERLSIFLTDFFRFGARIDSFRMPVHVQNLAEFLYQKQMPGAGVFMRRGAWEAIGGYCEHPLLKLGQDDTDFWLSVFSKDLAVVHVPGPLYSYRKHANSMTSTFTFDYHRIRRLIESRHRALLERGDPRRLFLAEGFWRSGLIRWWYARRRDAEQYARKAFRIANVELDARSAAAFIGDAYQRDTWHFQLLLRTLSV